MSEKRAFPIWEQLRTILASNLSTAEKLLLITIADHGGKDGKAFADQDTLAKAVSLKPRQLRNVILALSDRPQGKDKDDKEKPGPPGPGILAITRRPGGHGVFYSINWQKIEVNKPEATGNVVPPATECHPPEATGNFQQTHWQCSAGATGNVVPVPPAISDTPTGNVVPVGCDDFSTESVNCEEVVATDFSPNRERTDTLTDKGTEREQREPALPPKLAELISAWQTLPPDIAKKITNELPKVRKGWEQMQADPETRPHFDDPLAIVEKLRKSHFAHQHFRASGICRLFRKTDKGEWVICNLMAGLYLDKKRKSTTERNLEGMKNWLDRTKGIEAEYTIETAKLDSN